MNVNESHVGEEVCIAILNSTSSHAPPSLHVPEITLSCVLKILASYGIFWQGKLPGGVGTLQKHGEQVPTLVCDRQNPLSGRGRDKHVLEDQNYKKSKHSLERLQC